MKSDGAKPPQRKHWGANYLRLSSTAHFLLHERACLVAPLKPRGNPHLSQYLILSQQKIRMDAGPLEARAIYIPESHVDPLVEGNMLARRITWDRQGDRARCRKRSVIYPDIKSECFSVRGAGIKVINNTMTKFTKSLESLSVHHYWLSRDWPAEIPPDEPVKVREGGEFRWISFSAHPATVELRFVSSWMTPSINRAWQKLWDAIGAEMDLGTYIPRVTMKDGLSARDYARALASGVRDD